jgi:membrane protein required for colicin V production
MYGIGWVDLGFMVIALISVLAGLFRGFVFEVLSLIGWVAAYLAAKTFTPDIAPHLPLGASGSALNHGVAFALVFIVVLLLWSLAARLISMLIKATPLSPIDRLLGAAFGVARALVLALVVATVVGMSPAAKSPAWRESLAAGWLRELLDGMTPVWPQQAPARQVDA